MTIFRERCYINRELINSRWEGAMYLDYEVKIPASRHVVKRKTVRGITYIYYAYDHKYSSDN